MTTDLRPATETEMNPQVEPYLSPGCPSSCTMLPLAQLDSLNKKDKCVSEMEGFSPGFIRMQGRCECGMTKEERRFGESALPYLSPILCFLS